MVSFAREIDAALTFAVSIVRASLLSNYDFEKHDSDAYDFLQLHYLASHRFCPVTRDTRLLGRISGSPQLDRVRTFEAFAATL